MDRWSRPLLAYLILEVAGGTGYALVWLLPALSPLLAPLFGQILDNAILLNGIRLALSFLLMLVPSLPPAGMTLPLLVRGDTSPRFKLRSGSGQLVRLEHTGRNGRALIGELGPVASVGIRGAAAVAGALNIGRLAGLPSGPSTQQPGRGTEHHREAPKPFPPAVWLLAAAAALEELCSLRWKLSGFACSSSTTPSAWNFQPDVGSRTGRHRLRWIDRRTFFQTVGYGLLSRGTSGFVAGTWVAGGYFLADRFRPGSGWSPDLAVLPGAISLMFPVALASGVLFTLLDKPSNPKWSPSAGPPR